MTAALEWLPGILGQSVYLMLLIGAGLSVLIGILLLVDSARVLRWNSVLNGWFSTETALGPLEAWRDVKRMVYRGHRMAGLLVATGALYAVAALWSQDQGPALARAFKDLGSPEVTILIFESLRLFLLAGNVAAFAAGALMFFRPSLLKPIEGWADRIYGKDLRGDRLNKMHLHADHFAKAHPRLLGVFAAAGGAFVIVNLYLFTDT
jgi:hypothetical protein